ncbi:MAG: hypothetical protein HOL62_03335 [Candidatus Marinimicrobia bacterium]|jgi:hypothetical protein|nr:hypothetical protein [Candidatus Neomarinimicrobiota bacterium]MBT3944763.1 hypothetical protein [Candidatus Neomarinimicrobiota bacterium]MBT4925915.1 hypothetical protein [Candidatus Neomarinimicrobiota bacterium]MBT5251719.1 hypothetical protein [Candidatus Neomarinimicrobiota bacterium]MBT5490133.1 hypothetical protein [Candidatus Neomarinimicrobiota bacterium]|tara:strand:- start:3864 stop:4043 length:180 start_codon:yes stop_codon:yes gene_type:complete
MACKSKKAKNTYIVLITDTKTKQYERWSCCNIDNKIKKYLTEHPDSKCEITHQYISSGL